MNHTSRCTAQESHTPRASTGITHSRRQHKGQRRNHTHPRGQHRNHTPQGAAQESHNPRDSIRDITGITHTWGQHRNHTPHGVNTRITRPWGQHRNHTPLGTTQESHNEQCGRRPSHKTSPSSTSPVVLEGFGSQVWPNPNMGQKSARQFPARLQVPSPGVAFRIRLQCPVAISAQAAKRFEPLELLEHKNAAGDRVPCLPQWHLQWEMVWRDGATTASTSLVAAGGRSAGDRGGAR